MGYLFCHSCKKEVSFRKDACSCEEVTLLVSKEELYLSEAVILARFKEQVEKAIANVPTTPPSLEWKEDVFGDFDDFDDWDEFIVGTPESRNCDNDGDEDYSEFEQFMEELFG